MPMNIVKRFAPALLLAAGILAAQALVGTLADITGDGATHKVSATVQGARWVRFGCLTGNSAVIRLGDASTGSARGAACPAGSVMDFPPLHTSPYSYDLSKIYYYAANSDKLTVTFGK